MSVLLDTAIPGSANIKLLNAFLYGVVEGTYTLYKTVDNRHLAINFENEEDATVFKLKALDKIFVEEFETVGMSDPFGNHSHLWPPQNTGPTNNPYDLGRLRSLVGDVTGRGKIT